MQLKTSQRLEGNSHQDKRATVVDAGSLTLHGCPDCNGYSWDGSYNSLLFEVDPVHLERITEGKLAGGRVEIPERVTFKDLRLENLLKVLYDELRQGGATGRMFGEQVGNAIAILLAKHYSAVTPSLFGSAGRMPMSRLKRVMDYIEANLDDDLQVSTLAKEVDMSPYYFTRLFKNSTGMSPHQYVMQCRIKRAQEWLRKSEMSICEIGVGLGYLDLKHFRDVFRREVGVSPSAFRAAHL
jgi:AraC family transcriptional regulator